MSERFTLHRSLMQGVISTAPPAVAEYADAYTKDALVLLDSGDTTLISAEEVAQYLETSGKMQSTFESIPCMPMFDQFWVETPVDDRGSADETNRYGVFGFRHVFEPRTWIMMPFFATANARKPIPSLYTAIVKFREDGTADTDVQFHSPMHEDDAIPEANKAVATDLALSGVMIATTTFMFAHCKNVDLVERLPKRHEQREAKRRGEPILKYHEIVIDPNRSYATAETSRNASTAPSKSLHLVRGHFAHYTEDKPLFGKYSGTFWVPAHVRGSAEVGTVKSTYRVKAGTP